MPVLLPGGQSSPDMPLLLIHVQNFPGLGSQPRIQLLKSLRDVLMYCALTYPEFLCGLPNGCAVFYDILRNLHGSFLDIIFQKNSPTNIVFTMYAEEL